MNGIVWVAALLVAVIIILLLVWYCRSNNQPDSTPPPRRLPQTKPSSFSVPINEIARQPPTTPAAVEEATRLAKSFPYKELREAAGSFNAASMIGKGRFGNVYKAKNSGYSKNHRDEFVAVRRIIKTEIPDQTHKEILEEIDNASSLSHCNLVQLIGYSLSSDKKVILIVMEYISDALHKKLFPAVSATTSASVLSWPDRYKIARGLVAAVEYLHSGTSVIHGNIKLGNVMLGEGLIPKLGDFGLPRLTRHIKSMDKTPATEIVPENPSLNIHFYNIQSNGDLRSKTIKQILDASEEWGFFQLVNHGVPLKLLDELIQGIRLFHEQDPEKRREYYTRDMTKTVMFNSNNDLFKSKTANWRDTLTILTQYTGHLDPTELPNICRDVIVKYTSEATKLADTLLDLMSEGLGLTSAETQLGGMECTKGWDSVYHYYPSCPEPHMTLGNPKHTDPSFLTVLLQDEIGGLQVLHEDRWVNVHPVPGSLVINIGDLLQMISNDKLKSVEHRVVTSRAGPRISAAIFFTGLSSSPKVYGPVKELVSAENPALYKEFTLGEFYKSFFSKSIGEARFGNYKV